MADMKSLPDRDPARAKLAAAISLEAGAVRDLQVAEQAAELAESRHWEAQSRLEALRKEPHAPIGSLAAEFISSVGSGNPCNVGVLERSSTEARAAMVTAENEIEIWKQTHEECALAVREKEDSVALAKERVQKAARMVISNPETVTRLMDGLEAMQSKVIERRVALRFILFKGLNDRKFVQARPITGWVCVRV
jgi:hypothetical protein